MREEVGAFGLFELSKSVGSGCFESIDGSGGVLADVGLELGEGVFDRVEVRTVGRQVKQGGAARFNGVPDAGDLMGGRLSMTTISPCRRAGASICSHQARKISPSIGWSMSIGAMTPARVNPPTKVMVFQCPWGTAARQRRPLGAQPRSRAIFVDSPLSSMKIKLSGSRSACRSSHASRAAFTSGRSCSLACAVFFCASGRAGRETSRLPS